MNTKLLVRSIVLITIMFSIGCLPGKKTSQETTVGAVIASSTPYHDFKITDTAILSKPSNQTDHPSLFRTLSPEVSSTQRSTLTPDRASPIVSVSTNQPTVIPTTTPDPKNLQSLILYQKQNEQGRRSAWIRTTDGKIRRLLSEQYVPISWSPSGKWLLFKNTRDYSELYLAENDGENPRQIFRIPDADKESFIWWAWWISEEEVLIQAGSKAKPIAYLVSAMDGEVSQQYPERVIVAVSPLRPYWLQLSIRSELYSIASNNGESVPILNAEITWTLTPEPAHDIVFSTTKDELFYWECDTNDLPEQQCYIYRAEIENYQLTNNQPIRSTDGPVQNMAVSPNGRYLAYVDHSNVTLQILNLQLLDIKTEFPWNQPYSPPFFTWSPDSDALVGVYMTLNPQFIARLIYFDLKTNETSELEYGIIEFVVDWRRVSYIDQ